MAADPTEPEDPEVRQVRRRRYREARAAGLSTVDARAFAWDDEIDIGELRRLAENGCPPELLAQILL